MNTDKKIDLLLRIGVAFAFLYPPISALFNPFAWIGYFPFFLTNLFSDPIVLLHFFGVVEVIVGLWILSGAMAAVGSARIQPSDSLQYSAHAWASDCRIVNWFARGLYSPPR